ITVSCCVVAPRHCTQVLPLIYRIKLSRLTVCPPDCQAGGIKDQHQAGNCKNPVLPVFNCDGNSAASPAPSVEKAISPRLKSSRSACCPMILRCPFRLFNSLNRLAANGSCWSPCSSPRRCSATGASCSPGSQQRAKAILSAL